MLRQLKVSVANIVIEFTKKLKNIPVFLPYCVLTQTSLIMVIIFKFNFTYFYLFLILFNTYNVNFNVKNQYSYKALETKFLKKYSMYV